MPKRDSLLHYFQKIGMIDDFPRLEEYLRLEDVVIPDLRNMLQFCELEEQYKKQKPERIRNEIEAKEAKRRANDISAENSPEKTNEKNDAEPKPRSLLSYLSAPENLLRDWHEKEIRQIISKTIIPPNIKERYKGLTDFEALGAYEAQSAAAYVITSEHNPVFHAKGDPDSPVDLDAMMNDLCATFKLKRPRLIVIESDFFSAMSLNMPEKPKESSIMISSNIMASLSKDAIKAVLAHELNHTKERRGMGIVAYNAKHSINNLTMGAPILKEEFRSDEAGMIATGNADAISEMMQAFYNRTLELNKFATKIRELMCDHNIQFKALPPAFNKLYEYINSYTRIFPEKNLMQKRLNDFLTAHPVALHRIDYAVKRERQLGLAPKTPMGDLGWMETVVRERGEKDAASTEKE